MLKAAVEKATTAMNKPNVFRDLDVNDLIIDKSDEIPDGADKPYKDLIELSYIDYDLEILPSNFTFASVDLEKKGIIMLYQNEYDINDMDVVQKEVADYYNDYNIVFLDGRNPKNWVGVVRRFANYYRKKNGKTYEWRGWNSKNYDLMILSVIIANISQKMRVIDTQLIRKLSDTIIVKGYSNPYLFFKYLRDELFTSNNDWVDYAEEFYYECLVSLRHIDTGALNEKGKDNSAGKKFMFPLKSMSSFLGMDVLDDDTTRLVFDNDFTEKWTTFPKEIQEKINPRGALTDKGLAEMMIYNVRDIINTGLIYEEPEYKGALESKDMLRQLFPYLNKNMNGDLRPDRKILPRDATASQMAGKIIRGPRQVRLHDNEAIDFTWRFEDGHKENLLDYVEREEYVHPLFIKFYRNWEGKDVSDMKRAKEIRMRSLTGKNSMHIPYMDDKGRATSAFATPSIGGAHGTIYDASKYNDIYKMDMLDEGNYGDILALSKGSSITTATVDVRNVIHADFSSYYPTMSIRLGIYETGQKDYYREVVEERFRLKAMKPHKPFSEWTADEIFTQNAQEALKLVINGATGAANQQKEYVDLPLDNKITSMRIIGNILIYTLGQRFAKIGGLIVSTNTDGLYVANVSQEVADDIVKDFISTYGLLLDPEPMERLINKDVNNRIEFDGGHIDTVGGQLSNCIDKTPSQSFGGRKRFQMVKSPNFPLVAGKVALDYMATVEGWLDETAPDKEKILELYDTYLYEDPFRPDIWTVTLKGNRDRIHYMKPLGSDEEYRLQDTNRLVFSNTGSIIHQMFKGKVQKITGFTSDEVRVVNKREELFNIDIMDIDVDAYIEWTVSILKNWQTYNASVPELNQGPPVYQQSNLFEFL